MQIGIIGSGNIGSILAKDLTALGHKVLIANSRGPSTLSEIAKETGAKAATVEEAANAKDIVIISIPEGAIPSLPINEFESSSAIIIDTGNYYPSRDGRIEEIERGITDSEWVSKVIRRPVIKAFNNIVAPSLKSKGVPKGEPNRIALSVAGDDLRAKKVVLEIIDALGFDGVDTGLLSESWRQQIGMPAYCRDLDVNGLREALAKPDRTQVATIRAEVDEQARPYFESLKR